MCGFLSRLRERFRSRYRYRTMSSASCSKTPPNSADCSMTTASGRIYNPCSGIALSSPRKEKKRWRCCRTSKRDKARPITTTAAEGRPSKMDARDLEQQQSRWRHRFGASLGRAPRVNRPGRRSSVECISYPEDGSGDREKTRSPPADESQGRAAPVELEVIRQESGTTMSGPNVVDRDALTDPGEKINTKRRPAFVKKYEAEVVDDRLEKVAAPERRDLDVYEKDREPEEEVTKSFYLRGLRTCVRNNNVAISTPNDSRTFSKKEIRKLVETPPKSATDDGSGRADVSQTAASNDGSQSSEIERSSVPSKLKIADPESTRTGDVIGLNANSSSAKREGARRIRNPRTDDVNGVGALRHQSSEYCEPEVVVRCGLVMDEGRSADKMRLMNLSLNDKLAAMNFSEQRFCLYQ